MDNSAFYNVTLKNFAAPWSNRDQPQFIKLNDYTATIIGMIRDQVPFNEVLSADLLYIGDPSLPLAGLFHDEQQPLRGTGGHRVSTCSRPWFWLPS